MSGTRLNVYEFLKFLSASDKEALEAFRPLSGKRIVITGKLEDGLLRETLTGALTRWGAVVDTSVYPSTDVLLAVDPDRMTAKRKDAARFAVDVMNEHAFTDWLGKARERAIEDRVRIEAARAAAAAPVPPPTWFAGADPEDEEFVDEIAPLGDVTF
jgi:hypothetical protein